MPENDNLFFCSVHIKIHVPELIHNHNHQHTIYKETPTARYEITVSDPDGGTKEHIVLHSHDFNPENEYAPKQKYSYNPEKKQKTKYKKAGKKSKKPKKYDDDQDFKKILENYEVKPEEKNDDNGGFKTSVRTEHYEVKKINPNARYPDEKYIIEGAYKVQETDPWGQPVTSFHKYDSPISKIAASILTNYDYTNVRPGESDSYNKEKEEDRDHENIEYGANDDGYNNKKKSQNYNPANHEQKSPDYSKYEEYEIPNTKNNGKDYEKSAGYEVFVNEKKAYHSAPNSYAPTQTSHQNSHSNQRYVNQKPQGYTGPQGYGTFKPDDSKRVENLEKRPVQVVYIAPQDSHRVQGEIEYEIAKEFGHLVQPGHTDSSSDSHYDYDNEWEKHLIDYVYGENQAASNKFVQKVKPQK